MRSIFLLFLPILFVGCSTLDFHKDDDFNSFEKAMNQTILKLKVKKNHKLLKNYEDLLIYAQKHWGTKEFDKYIKENFKVVKTKGKEGDGKILLTGYYSPVIKVSKSRNIKYNTPIYSRPKKMRKPYYKRSEIEEKGVLSKDHVIAYADIVDVFFLHIQGSGIIQYKNGSKKYVNFSDHNGHKYVSIGKTLLDIIPREKMSMQSIKEYLATLDLKGKKEILYRNPRYIFFKLSKKPPQTHFGTNAIAGRTIATDQAFYKKPGLGFIQMDKDSKVSSRFIFDHDIGGGVKGEHRVDLYVGEGKEAEIAGKMYERGRLFYLAPKN